MCSNYQTQYILIFRLFRGTQGQRLSLFFLFDSGTELEGFACLHSSGPLIFIFLANVSGIKQEYIITVRIQKFVRVEPVEGSTSTFRPFPTNFIQNVACNINEALLYF